MHLVEQYSLVTGAKINKPFIETSYYPIPFEKYIVVENGGEDIKSRIYSMWTDIIASIKDYLDAENIKIVQIGAADSQEMHGVFDLRGRTTTKQLAYIIKNSLLHCSTNDFLLDIASHFNIPVVGMYGNTYADVAKPYWGNTDKKILIESHRNGNKPSFLAEEKPNTVNLIYPEKVVDAILKLLDIEQKEKIKTQFIGDLYSSHVLEGVPDFVPPDSFQPNMIVNLRMDYHFDLNNMVQWAKNRKVNIFTNKIIDLNYLNAIKSNVVAIQQEVCSDLNLKYLNILNNLKIPCELFTKNERALNNLRLKYFDHKVIYQKIKIKEDIKDFEFSKDFQFKSNKLLLSKEKKYLSKYDYVNNRPYEKRDLKIVDNPDFWEDLDFFRIYKKC
tara:strand:+ start:1989 stop:3149 length:1161 start_codon:yes stop_codon:yes gene_type:complete